MLFPWPGAHGGGAQEGAGLLPEQPALRLAQERGARASSASKLSTHLIGAIRKQLPVIQHSINDGIIGLERELEALGGPAVTTRGAMVHLSLQVRPLPSAVHWEPALHRNQTSE